MNPLTPETKMTIDAAARLIGCSARTIDRRRDAGELEYEKDGIRNMVTVGALVAAGLYELGTESAEEASRCEKLIAECKTLREEVLITTMDRDLLQVRARGMEKELEAKEKETAALRGQIVQLERLVRVLEGYAPKSMDAGVN